MFWGQLFQWCICQAHPTLPSPRISRWRTDTGSSYNFATENDIKVILVAVAMFYGTPDPLSQLSTLTDFGEQRQEVETIPETGSTNNLTTETDIDAISVAIPMFWEHVFHWCICQHHPTLTSPRNSKMADGYRK